MALKAAEIGKTINYYTGYDLTSNTDLELTITDSAGDTVTIAIARISVPGGSIVDADLGTLDGDTVMQFTTLATDFPTAGTYSLQGKYVDGSSEFYGDVATITVEAGYP